MAKEVMDSNVLGICVAGTVCFVWGAVVCQIMHAVGWL